MSKYTEVDALKECIRKSHGIKTLEYLLPIEKEMVDAIDNAPSIDIVHCGKCKHRRICFGRLVQGVEVVQLHFCSCGEREDE